MAILKIANSKALPRKCIEYNMNEDKCVASDTILLSHGIPYHVQFMQTAKIYGKYEGKDERKYYNIKMSFDPKNNIANGGKMTPNAALDIARDFAVKSFPGHEVVLSIHNDKPHLHAHILLNAINLETGKSLHLNDGQVRELKDRAMAMTRARGYEAIDWRAATELKRERTGRSIEVKREENRNAIEADRRRITNGKDFGVPEGEAIKDELKNAIDEAKYMSRNIKEFENVLKSKGIVLNRNTEKTISYRYLGTGKAVRGKTLGEEYTKGSIIKELSEKRVPEWWSTAMNNFTFIENRVRSLEDIQRVTSKNGHEVGEIRNESNKLKKQIDIGKIIYPLLIQYEAPIEARRRKDVEAAKGDKVRIKLILKEYGVDPDKTKAAEVKIGIYKNEAKRNILEKKYGKVFTDHMACLMASYAIEQRIQNRERIIGIDRGEGQRDRGIELSL